MRSLAEELKLRREAKEKMSIERMKLSYNNALKEMPTPFNIRQAARIDTFERRVLPRQSDNTGTMFRIRPQTPKLNLLTKTKQNQNPGGVRLASIDRQNYQLPQVNISEQMSVHTADN